LDIRLDRYDFGKAEYAKFAAASEAGASYIPIIPQLYGRAVR
jgi:hypothetical protein